MAWESSRSTSSVVSLIRRTTVREIVEFKEEEKMLILLLILLLMFGGGGGYYGYNRWGHRGGAGIGLSTILLILLIAYLAGVIR